MMVYDCSAGNGVSVVVSLCPGPTGYEVCYICGVVPWQNGHVHVLCVQTVHVVFVGCLLWPVNT